jgi:drug/metabolite transporter (DMT)-like permease
MTSGATAPPERFGAAGLGLLAAVSLVWGIAYILIREGIVLGASPVLFAAARYALSALAFALLAMARREPFPERSAWLVSAVVGGILVIGLYGGLLYWGEQYTTGGYAAVLASTAPLLTVGFGSVLLASERLGTWGMAGMGVGFAGTAVLVYPQLSGSPIGSWEGPLFVVLAMIATSAGSVLLRRYGRGRQGLWQIGTQFAVAGLLLGGATLFLPGGTSLPATAGVLASLACLVLLSSMVGYFAYFALHHRVGPIRANVVAYIVPLVGVATGSGILGEPFTVWEIGGVAIVLAGVTLVLRDPGRSAPAGPPAARPVRG